MKKLIILSAFLFTGLPAWRWALPADEWQRIDARLPAVLHSFIVTQPIAWCGRYTWLYSAIWITLFIGIIIATQAIGVMPLAKDKRGFQQVDRGTPHSYFRQTKDGFKVAIRNNDSLGEGLFVAGLTLIAAVVGGLVSGVTATLLLAAAFGAAISFLIAVRWPTRVREKPNAIIITDHDKGKKKLDRRHFVSFTSNDCHLGYTYGQRHFLFGGRLEAGLIIEIASALNQLVYATPAAVARPSKSFTPRAQRSEF